MRISEEFLRDSRRKGREGESLFLLACQSRGLTCEPSSKNENMFGHIDFHITDGGEQSFSVDVKGARDEMLLEYKNVRGDKGWLYGDADYMAFLSPSKDSFLIVPRQVLADYAERFKTAPRGYKELYKLYSRKGRKDLMVYVKWQDIENLPNTKNWKI